ncbi:MAG TPA: hypothetical protein VEC75_09495, partial [Stellaceae bacterium]|nr:hypothetical protein [Stellaceae bacterium]
PATTPSLFGTGSDKVPFTPNTLDLNVTQRIFTSGRTAAQVRHAEHTMLARRAQTETVEDQARVSQVTRTDAAQSHLALAQPTGSRPRAICAEPRGIRPPRRREPTERHRHARAHRHGILGGRAHDDAALRGGWVYSQARAAKETVA